MHRWIKYHVLSGQIVGEESGDAEEPALAEGWAAMEVEQATPAAPADWYVAGGVLVARERMPFLTFSVTTLDPDQYVLPDEAWWRLNGGDIGRDLTLPEGDNYIELVGRYAGSLRLSVLPLAARRAARWEAAKTIRDAHILGGCSSPFGRIDTDLVSQATISAFAARAESSIRMSLGYSVEFIMADDGVEPHDEPALIDLNVALTDHLDACRTNASAIRAALMAATTPEAVAAVDIEAGYPEPAP